MWIFVFLDLNLVIEKIIYYIKNNFALENEKLKFYKKFSLKRNGNTKRLLFHRLFLRWKHDRLLPISTKEIGAPTKDAPTTFKRKERDSNPRYLSVLRFSRPTQ